LLTGAWSAAGFGNFSKVVKSYELLLISHFSFTGYPVLLQKIFIMKKLLLLSLFAGVAFASCKKKDDGPSAYTCTACATAPAALAANDASSKGVYKGVLIGSTGTISFDVQNGGTTITARMVIDGTTVDLTSAVSWTAGVPLVAPFTGTLNGSPVSITFSIGSGGESPTITTSSIPGHPNAEFTVIKETSTSLVQCFEGTYHTTKPEDGTFNMMVSKTAKIWGAQARKNGETESDGVSGTVTDDNKIKENNGTIMGTITGDVIEGSFADNNGQTVTIKGKRTL
jgi:hypothetical protein